MDISGKKAIVFGGTSGIGFATIKMLAQKKEPQKFWLLVEILIK